MSYSILPPSPYAGLPLRSGPASLQTWFKTALARLWPAAIRKAPPPRDLAREAAEVRTWAESVRRTDPRFADDLFAAADRHEVGLG